MKVTLFLLGAVALTVTHAAQQVFPDSYPADRYEKLKKEWPFTLAAPKSDPAPPPVSWAESLCLSSVVIRRTAEGGEQPWVTIKKKQEPGSFIQLTPGEEKEGMELLKVENLDNPKQTTATLKKDNKIATLKLDESSQPAPPASNPGAPRGGGPAAHLPSGLPNGAFKPSANPRPTSTLPKPAPGVQSGAVPGGPPRGPVPHKLRLIDGGK